MSFANLIRPMFEQVNLLKKRNLNLRRVRDLLLPKLIGGEIDLEELDIILDTGNQL